MEMIRKEMERDAPRKDQLLLLMKLTYPARREFILSDSTEVTATSIPEKYGVLSLVPVVSSCLIAACSHCDTASAGHHHVNSLSCSFFGQTFFNSTALYPPSPPPNGTQSIHVRLYVS